MKTEKRADLTALNYPEVSSHQPWSRCSFLLKTAPGRLHNVSDMHDWSVWTAELCNLKAWGSCPLQKQPLDHKQTVIITSRFIVVWPSPHHLHPLACHLNPLLPLCPSLSASVAPEKHTYNHAHLHASVKWGGSCETLSHVLSISMSCVCTSFD